MHLLLGGCLLFFFFSSRRRHTRYIGDWSSDVCSSDLYGLNANESYVTLLGNWGMLIMGAYFGGRTVEKLAEMRKK